MVPRQILETFSPADPSLVYSMSYSYSTSGGGWEANFRNPSVGRNRKRTQALRREGHEWISAYMASLIAKKKGNQLYYYVVESARVDGQPRIVHQSYLGSAERVAALVRDRTAPVPLSATMRDFGLPGALWLAAQQTGVFELLHQLWPQPRSGPLAAQPFTPRFVNVNRTTGLFSIACAEFSEKPGWAGFRSQLFQLSYLLHSKGSTTLNHPERGRRPATLVRVWNALLKPIGCSRRGRRYRSRSPDRGAAKTATL